MVALTATPARADQPRFGELAPGFISTSDMSGVEAEICRAHLFDPQAVRFQGPAGFRLILAEEAASTNTAVAALLAADPGLGRHALGSLCFMSVRSFVIDGVPVHPPHAMPVAFWWAAAQGPRHAHMRGKLEWIQLGSWYPANARHQAAISRTDPMAAFIDLEMRQFEPGAWRLRLALPGETVTAEVRSADPPRPSTGPQPGHMTVPLSGAGAGHFAVFTYFGHHHRPAQGRWQSTGQGVFSAAFAIPNEAASFGTEWLSGWSARAALYRFGPP